MKLDELMKSGTPLPWEGSPTGMVIGNAKGNIRFVADFRQHGFDAQDEIDMKLAVHAVNMFHRLVKALEGVLNNPLGQTTEEGVKYCAARTHAAEVLDEANNLEGIEQ